MPNTVGFNDQYPDISRSQELYARALGLIPNVTQTLAKGPTQNSRGVMPIYLERGHGSHVWDVDGNEYIDMTMGVGPLSLGYCHPVVDDAIRRQLESGITFSLMHPLEVDVAELAARMIPNAESVRYSKTGADVTSAAVRVARAFTGRDRVLCCGYHGWHDWYVSVTARNHGVPTGVQDLTNTFNYNDIESVAAAIDDDTACVILEPAVFEEPRDGFLEELRALCDRHGALLIFDEMWTGFRLAPGGAQQYFNVRADLATFSKAMANGMPISMLTGRRDVMQVLEDHVFFFTTFGGEALSLAAAKATMTLIAETDVTGHIARQGLRLRDGYNEIAEKLGVDYSRCSGFAARSIVAFDSSAGDPLEVKALMQQEMIRRGVLWGGFNNMSLAHSDQDVEHTLEAYGDALAAVDRAVRSGDVRSAMRGEPLEPVFRRTDGFNTKPRTASETR